MVEKDVQVFSFDGRSLKEVGRIKVDGGPAAVRTAEEMTRTSDSARAPSITAG